MALLANTRDATITKFDVEHGTKKTLEIAADEPAFGAGTLWASEQAAGKVIRIDPRTGKESAAPI